MRYKFILMMPTTAAIKNQLCGKWRSVGIMSDEAGIIFDGYTLSELPFINKNVGWLCIVCGRRMNEQMIENARMTLSPHGAQPGLFDRYMEQKVLLPGTVVSYRCLISKPATTQNINGAVIPGGSLTAFHERLMELAREQY